MDANRIFEVYRKSSKLLQLKSAYLLETEVHSYWTQEEPYTKKAVHIKKIFKGNIEVTTQSLPSGLVALNAARNIIAGIYNDNNKCYLELWCNGILSRRYDLSQSRLHGIIYTNEFGSLSWSHDESRIVYVAEALYNDADYDNTSQDYGQDKFKYKDNWGVCHQNCHKSVICILELKTGNVEVINISDSLFWSNPVFYTNNSLLLLGYEDLPFKHGRKWMDCRPCRLFRYNLSTKILEALTSTDYVVISFSVNPSNQKVALIILKVNNQLKNQFVMGVASANHLLINEVVNSQFFSNLSERSLAGWIDDDHVLIVELIGQTNVITKVNTTNGYRDTLLLKTFPLGSVSFDVLDVMATKVLFMYSSFNPVNESCQQGLAYFNLKCSNEVRIFTKPCQSNLLQFKVEDFLLDGAKYNGILVRPKNEVSSCVAVVSYGKTHSVIRFDKFVYNLAQLKFSILIVDYAGLSGIVNELPGKPLEFMGENDVKRVHAAVMEIKSRYNYKTAVVFGLSYGGFLAAHLISRYSDTYKAGGLINPIIDFTSLAQSSDSPDWCFKEAGYEYDFAFPPLPDQTLLEKWVSTSPTFLVNQVRCPLAIMVGQNDVRVPPSQGIHYYKYLRSRGVKCTLRQYPDGHLLDKPEVAADVFCHLASLFLSVS